MALVLTISAVLLGVLIVVGAIGRSRPGISGRSRASAALGAGAGLAAGAGWSAAMLIHPPVPASSAPALLMVGAAAWGAGEVRARRVTPASREVVVTVLFTVATGCVLIFLLAAAAFSYGPASWVPNLVPMALTPADRLSNSRIEAVDPFVLVLFFSLVAVIGVAALTVSDLRGRRKSGGSLVPASTPG